MSHNIGLQVLRAKLRGFHASGTTISSRISRSEKERKHRLWDAKRQLGDHCRHHLIAYGLLRGLSYGQIERCAPSNRPNPTYVLRIMQEHGQPGLTLETVEKLLTVIPVGVVPVAASVPCSTPTEPPKQGLLKMALRLLEKRS